MDVEGAWTWTSGEPAAYTRWAPGEPNNSAPGTKHYAHLWLQVGSQWNDTVDDPAATGRLPVNPRGVVELGFDPTLRADVVSFGSGCASPTGAIPLLDAHFTSLPRLGMTFTMEARSLPPLLINVPFSLFGLSNTQVPGGVSLPLDLSVIGAAGGDLLASADDTIILANNGGTTTWQLPVPLICDLAGASLFTQVVALAPSTNPLGLVVTNGLRLTLGY
jgi:hypothetical protein